MKLKQRPKTMLKNYYGEKLILTSKLANILEILINSNKIESKLTLTSNQKR